MFKKVSTIIMLSLFFIGLSVLLYPSLSAYWNSKTQSQVVEGEDYCTLVTCTPYGINTHRLLVRGKRLDTMIEWTYTWTTIDDGAIWQAVETNVPEGYTVTLEQNGNYFFVTNSYEGSDDPPDAGDIRNPRLYFVIMCVAGLGLVVLGLTGKKKGKA